jgi:hypothetical protein
VKLFRKLIVTAVISMCVSQSNAADVTYSFDTLSSFTLDTTTHSITGVLRNSTTQQTVSMVEATNDSYHYIVDRCVPLFLTMLEKPGRYYLNIVVDPAAFNVQLRSCSLEVRS